MWSVGFTVGVGIVSSTFRIGLLHLLLLMVVEVARSELCEFVAVEVGIGSSTLTVWLISLLSCHVVVVIACL